MTLETLSSTQRRLNAAGFVDDLTVRGDQLHGTPSGRSFDPKTLRAVEIVRFEGNSDPDDEALLVAVASLEGDPIGTFTVPYGPDASAAQADALRHLHRVLTPRDEISGHDSHDHVAAVFPDHKTAEAGVADLRELGLGSEHLGVAAHQAGSVVFENDEEADLAHSAEMGTAAGAVLGFLGGMLLFSLAVSGIGVGGILALGAGSVAGGAMAGGYWGVLKASDEFDDHERISHTRLDENEVLVVACSHGRRQAVEDAFLRHGGRLTQP